MYTAISAGFFVLLSLYALRVLFSKSSYVKYSKDVYVYLSGPEKFLLLTMVTGMIAVTPGGFSSLRLMFWIILIILGFVVYRKSIPFNTFVIVCLIFLIYSFTTLTWTANLSYGIRVFLKYLYPILIMLFAMSFIKSRDFIFITIKYMIISGLIISLFLGGFTTHFLGFGYIFYMGGVFWPIAALADFFAIISALSFVLWWKTGEKKYLFLIIWFLLSCTFQSVRTGLISIGLMIIVGIYLRYRFMSLPYIFGLIFLGLSIILFVPNVKEKMFYDTTKVQSFSDISGAIEEDNLNNSGRFFMWEVILNKFYERDKFFGQGLGTVQEHMYNNSHLYGGIRIPHNDFVQILSDMGKVGLVLYLLIPSSFILLNWKYFRHVKTDELSMIATIAILSYIAIIPAMNFDNVINYSFPTHSMPFIFIGLFYAHKRILIQGKINQNV